MYIALYARQSIDKENSISIETQLEYAKSMIRPDDRAFEIKCFQDKGYSGKDLNRPDYKRLIKDIRKGKVKKVVVYKLDRISRSLIDFVDMLREFKEYNVEFVSSQECFDTSSPYGEMICKLLMVFAEFERTSIVNRIRDAYEKRSDMGLYSGGRRTYGFDLADAVITGIKTKKLVPNDESAHIRYIFEVYAQPSVTLRMLQSNLLENGIKPLSGEDWTTGKLGTILRNPIYVKADADIYEYYNRQSTNIVGELKEFNGKHNIMLYGKSKHNKNLPDWSDMKIVLLPESEGLVDSETWLKCQRKLEQNKQIGNAMSNNTSWLSGKLVCSKCGHTMTTVHGETKKYFLCTGHSHKKTCSGIKRTIYVKDMEDMIDECIKDKLESLKLSRINHSEQNTAQINAIKLKVKEVEQQLSALSNAVLGGLLNMEMIETLNEKAKSLSAEKRKYLEVIDDLTFASSNVKETVNFAKKWSKANFKEKRAICNVLIKSIIIDEDGNAEILWNI